MILIWIGALYILVVTILWLLRRHMPSCKCARRKKVVKFSQPLVAWNATLGFLQGTFFEVMVGISVSMRKLQIWQYMNSIDKFGVANMAAVFVIMIILVIFVAYFAVRPARKLVIFKTH